MDKRKETTSTMKYASRRDQVPGRRKSGTEGAAGKKVVVHVPDRCLASARIEKQVIRLAVSVEIGSPRQLIPACNGRPKGAADKRNSREIPDRRLPRASIEE
jgi:hypothetical protein